MRPSDTSTAAAARHTNSVAANPVSAHQVSKVAQGTATVIITTDATMATIVVTRVGIEAAAGDWSRRSVVGADIGFRRCAVIVDAVANPVVGAGGAAPTSEGNPPPRKGNR